MFFHLVERRGQDEYPFAFLATYSRESSIQNKAEHVPLKDALLEYRDNQKLLLQLLAMVSRAAEISDFISELVESGELFSPLRFSSEEAYIFLKEIPLYEACGIMCRMPDWWKKKYNTIKLSVSIGDKPPSYLGLETLLSFSPSLIIDGEQITREELERLMAQTEGLSLLKGKWVEVDHKKLGELLDAYDRLSETSDDVTFAEAMHMQMGITDQRDTAVGDIAEVTNGQWLSHVFDSLKIHGKRQDITLDSDFHATLRHYQQDGLNWLASMKSFGFGALLADDMGLGKTIQVLALLEYLRLNSESKTLLIIPASLIGNWQNEIVRFTPKLRCSILHDRNTKVSPGEAGVFITTYGMVMRLEGLKEYTWDLVILDEAQAVKNPGTKQTRAVKAIPAKFRIALTGTPVENRLSDLWSLFDFLNAGLLGTSKEFSCYAKSIQSKDIAFLLFANSELLIYMSALLNYLPISQ